MSYIGLGGAAQPATNVAEAIATEAATSAGSALARTAFIGAVTIIYGRIVDHFKSRKKAKKAKRRK